MNTRRIRIAGAIKSLVGVQTAPWRDFFGIPAREFMEFILGVEGYKRFSELSYQDARNAANELRLRHRLNPKQYAELIRCIDYAQVSVHEANRVGSK